MGMHSSFITTFVSVMSGALMPMYFHVDNRAAHRAKHGGRHCAPQGEQNSKQQQ
jgi:hypothetical protein